MLISMVATGINYTAVQVSEAAQVDNSTATADQPSGPPDAATSPGGSFVTPPPAWGLPDSIFPPPTDTRAYRSRSNNLMVSLPSISGDPQSQPLAPIAAAVPRQVVLRREFRSKNALIGLLREGRALLGMTTVGFRSVTVWKWMD